MTASEVLARQHAGEVELAKLLGVMLNCQLVSAQKLAGLLVQRELDALLDSGLDSEAFAFALAYGGGDFEIVVS